MSDNPFAPKGQQDEPKRGRLGRRARPQVRPTAGGTPPPPEAPSRRARRSRSRASSRIPSIRLPGLRLPRMPRRPRRLRLSRPRLRRPRIPRPSPLFIVGVLVLSALGGLFALINSDYFQIDYIDVEGAVVVAPATIRQLVNLKGQHVLLADLDAARERVASLTMVKEVFLTKDWPNRVKVVIVERRPWARWRADDKVWPLDSEGVILEGAAAPADGPVINQTSALPAISAGAVVDTSAIALVAELDHRGAPLPLPRILAYEWSLAYGLVVVTEHGRIIFGDADGLDYKYAVWDVLEREAYSRGEPLLFADLRHGLRPRVEIGLNVGRNVRSHESAAADLAQSSNQPVTRPTTQRPVQPAVEPAIPPTTQPAAQPSN